MKPYYEQDGITIYHGDCREILPSLASRSVDLVLTDPPYGVNWQSNFRHEKFERIQNDDGTLDIKEVLREAIRLLKMQRHLYVFGRVAWDGLPVGGHCELIWDKQQVGPGNLSIPWGSSHEYITFGVSANSAQRARGTGNGAARLRRGTVLRCGRLTGVAVANHPTEKPVEILRELIESSSRIGETVLDPFVGCGSTLVSARLEGRRAIGIEIEERYCEIAAKRLQQAVLPLEGAAD